MVQRALPCAVVDSEKSCSFWVSGDVLASCQKSQILAFLLA
jgi:hypothetical protein